MQNLPFQKRLLSVLVLSAFWTPGTVLAQTVWSGGGGDSNWSTGTNWVGNTAPPSSNTAFVQFDATGANFGPAVNTPWTLNRLDLLGGVAYTLTGSALTFDGITPQVNASGATHGIGNNILLNAATLFNVDSGLALNDVSGAGGLTKNGAGILNASGPAWTYSGNTTLNAGTLSGSITSTGGLIVNGGTFNTGASTFGSLAGTGGTVNINGGTLTVGADNSNTTYAGAVASTGSLVKNGTGTLILEQLPTHAGTTTINAGTLQIGNGTAAAGTMGTIVNNGTLAINNTGGAGITLNALSGTGSLTKSGTDGLIAGGGAWTHSGDTTINAGNVGAPITSTGRLIVNGGTFNTGASTFGSLTGTGGTVNINGGTLTVGADNSNTTYAGAVASTGSLVKNGTGTLILEQLPTHAGTTTINAGTLQIGNGTAAAGTMGTIVNNGTLAINNTGGAGITLNALSGTGSLTKSGTGGLIAGGGAWTHSGDTTVNAGTIGAPITSTGRLIVNGGTFDTGASTFGSLAGTGGTININGGGTLTVGADNNSTTYAGVLGSDGNLVKNGTGTLTLTGTNTHFGTVQLNGGALVLNGTTAAAVAVNTGAIFGGTGTINNSLTANTGSVIAPGNSIGTMTVNGSLTFNAGSTYRVEADAAGASDRINVIGAPGTATIGGGTVDVQAGAGTYAPATVYTILNATGGVTGTFSAVTSNLAFLTPSLAYDANNVFLTLTRNTATFPSVAITPNQIAVSNMLQPVAAGAPAGDMAVVVNAVTGLSAAQARAAFDAIGGASTVEMWRANAAFARGFGDTLDARSGQPGAVPTRVAGAPMLLSSDERGFWIRGAAAGYRSDGDGNAFEHEVRGSSLTAGADVSPQEGMVIGVAVGYGRSTLEFDGIGDRGRSRNTAIGAYARYVRGPWTYRGMAGYAFGENRIDRPLVFGAISRVAHGEFDSHNGTAYAEAAYDIAMQGYRLRPLAGLSWTRSRQQGYTESGAGALNLNVAGQTTDSVRSLLGVKTLHVAGAGGALRIEPRLVWSHEFGDINPSLQAQLTGAGAAGHFTVGGVQLKRDALTAGITVSGALRKGTELYVDAQAGGNSRQTAYAAQAGVRILW